MRLRHPTARNVRYTVVDGAQLYAVPYHCPPPTQGGCGTTHQWKTYHLDLDDQGCVIVNTWLYERIRSRLALDGFLAVGHVARPPAQTIGQTALMPRVDLARPIAGGTP